ncbi:S-protein homolog 1 [Linum perenne]
MAVSVIHFIGIIATFATLFALPTTSFDFNFTLNPYHYVEVWNHLSDPKASLLVHCKSKDDDLGVHHIKFNNKYEWRFRDSIFYNTLFWCYLAPSNTHHVAFDAYRQPGATQNEVRPYVTVWVARDDGLFRVVKRRFAKNEEDFFVSNWQLGR